MHAIHVHTHMDTTHGCCSSKYRTSLPHRVQVFPIAAAISLPGLSVSPQQLSFGTCHLGRSVPLSLLLLNNNPVAALWTMEVLDQGISACSDIRTKLYTIYTPDVHVHT